MRGDWNHMGWGLGWIGAGLLWLVLIGAVVALVIVAVRAMSDRHIPSSTGAPQAQDTQVRGEGPGVALLRERFARGEIDAEEFEARLRVLRNS